MFHIDTSVAAALLTQELHRQTEQTLVNRAISQDLHGVSSDRTCARYPSAIAAKRRTGYAEAADVDALASA